MTRLRMLLVILAATVVIASCASHDKGLSPCGGGKTDPDRPMVCVDDSSDTLRVYPDPVKFNDVLSTDKTMSPAILWFTKSGRGNLEIRFRDEGCVRDVRCNGPQCVGAAARLDPLEPERRCKYDVMLTGHPTLDPETIIVRCCISG